MSRVFFTSDLHIGHHSLVNNLRGMDTWENARLILKNWNKTVSKRDTVYLLGDVTMDDPKVMKDFLSKLKGTIYLVAGNHDTRRCCRVATELGIQILGNVRHKGFILSHVPLHECEVLHTKGNIHGHIHIKPSEVFAKHMPVGKYFNVNTEMHNYTPVLFDVIQEWSENREEEELTKVITNN